METKVKVYGKAQNRIALGIINAYMEIHPEADLNELTKAFPDSINPDCGSKQLFMTEEDINKHVENGEEWYISPRGYFVKENEWLIMPDGERIGFVSMWSKSSLELLVEQAAEYGIEVEESDEKRGTYRLEYFNGFKPAKGKKKIMDVVKKTADNVIGTESSVVGNVSKAIGEKVSSIIKEDISDDKEAKTYHLRIESNLFYRVDVLELPKAKDAEIEDGYENDEGWTDFVGNTQMLYTRIEDFENAINEDDYGLVGNGEDGDEESVKKIMEMVDVSTVNDGLYFPDADEEFRIVLMNEDDEEIETIEGEDIPLIRFEEGYKYSDSLIEEEDDYQQKKDYIDKNNIDVNSRCNDFSLCVGGWSWVNVIQNSEMDEYPVYELKTADNFDSSKLSVKKVLLEEPVMGLMGFEAVTEILYDGKRIDEQCGWASPSSNDDSTNFFVKRESSDELPIVVYDFTNKEKAE